MGHQSGLCVRVCVCACSSVHTCVGMYTRMCGHTHACVLCALHTCVHTCMYVLLCTRVWACTPVCVGTCCCAGTHMRVCYVHCVHVCTPARMLFSSAHVCGHIHLYVWTHVPVWAHTCMCAACVVYTRVCMRTHVHVCTLNSRGRLSPSRRRVGTQAVCVGEGRAWP